jgi:mannosylglycerate hydrolase
MTECIVVPHTHWDREWYLSFERYRFRLVQLVDELLEILDTEKEYNHFLLDAQAIHLEDVLEIHPEWRGRLQEQIRKGRIGTGPWYTMPDEFLVSGESLIRNLLLGQELANEMGGAMRVGYLPDPFGHVSQMPQILHGFRIPYTCMSRGIDRPQAEFYWEAPDGSRVLTHWFSLGYCNAYRLPTDPEAPRCMQAEDVQDTIEKLSGRATAGVVLLMNGCDHLGPQRGIPGALAALQSTLGIPFKQGSLQDFFELIEARNPSLSIYRGEMRVSKHSPILPGVLSSRVYLKQRNQRLQTSLEGYAEPLAALGWTQGERYPGGFLRQAWKILLQNHFHDAICASSVDVVHREMVTRFDRGEQIAGEVIDESMRQLGQRLTGSGDERLILVFNPTAQARNARTELWIETENNPFDAQRKEPPEDWDSVGHLFLLDDEGGEIPGKLTEKSLMAGDTLSGMVLVEKQRLSFLARDVPPFGYRVYRVKVEGSGEEKGDSLWKGEWKLENDFLRVDVLEDGTLEVLDKETRTLYRDLGSFEDSGDSGDEYNYNPPVEQHILRTEGEPAQISLLEEEHDWATIRVRRPWRLPRGLTPDRQGRSEESEVNEFISDITLTRGVRRIDIRTEVENRVRDHRLRVRFPTGVGAVESLAQSAFTLERRSVQLPDGEDWIEAPSPTMPTSGVVMVEGSGLAVVGKGLHEYEVTAEGDIYLTLLRAVGWLSRNDLQTRKGHAGPPYETPEAQCLGRHVFEYAILPYGGRGEESRAVLEAQRFFLPPLGMELQGAHIKEGQGSFLQVEPPEMIVSALKVTEKGEALVLRLYNLLPEPVEGKLRLGFEVRRACEAGLNEEDLQALEIHDSELAFHARGGEIKTFKLYLERMP